MRAMPLSRCAAVYLRGVGRVLCAVLSLASAGESGADPHLMHGGAADVLTVPLWDDVFAEGPFELPIPTISGDISADEAARQGQLALAALRDDLAERWFRVALRRNPENPAALWGLAAANMDRPGRCAAFARRACGVLKPDSSESDRSIAEAFRKVTGSLSGPPTGAVSRSTALRVPVPPWDAASASAEFAELLRQMPGTDAAAAMMLKRHAFISFGSGDRIRVVPEGELPAERSPLVCRIHAARLAREGRIAEACAWLEAAARSASGILAIWPSEHRAMLSFHEALCDRADLLASVGRSQEAVSTAREAGPDCLRRLLIRQEDWEELLRVSGAAIPATGPESPERFRWLYGRTLAAIGLKRTDLAGNGLADLRECRSRWQQAPGAVSAAERTAADVMLTEIEAQSAISNQMTGIAQALLPKLARLERSRLAALHAAAGEPVTMPGKEAFADPFAAGIPELARLTELQPGPARKAFAGERAPAWLTAALADAAAGGAQTEMLRAVLEIPPVAAAAATTDLPADSGTPLWTAPAAPDFALTDAEGKERRLTEFTGAPCIVVFFLGFRCDHCLRQLDALDEWHARLAAQGIRVVAVSHDDRDGVQRTFAGPDRAMRQPYPFPILSDPEGKVFKAWSAWDQFQEAAVHGSYVLDPQGRILWRTAGTEPFMAVNALHDLAVQAK